MNNSSRSVGAALCGGALLVMPLTAHAIDWSLKLEPGMAAAAGRPQSHMFGPGFGLSLKGLLGVSRYADLQAGLTWVGLPARDPAPTDEIGGAWGVGAGVRVKRPQDLARGYSPWVDLDLMYVRTGGLNRFGFSIGTGVSMALDQRRRFWMGPFVRYMQVAQGDRFGIDDTDAKIFIVGASLELGSARVKAPERPPEPIVCAADVTTDRDNDGVLDGVDKCPTEPGPAALYGCPDRDGDGLANVADVCPDVKGPADNLGCPRYNRVVVKPERLELKEKILFSWDKAIIEPQSYALLDEVAQALKDNKSFKVRIEGHSDSTGPETHNQTLSEERARAVLDYLQKRGVAADRLAYRGFSSSQPMDRNDTQAGREANRRVEFVVELVRLNEGTPQ